MLQIEFAGKSVITTDKKQTIKVNGNDVEIERVGNSIYVNQLPINLIIVDKDNKWKNILLLAIMLPVIAAIAYFVAINHETVSQGFDAATDFIQTTVIPAVDSTANAIGGMINGNETGGN